MEQFINPRVKDIQISGIRQFSNMIQNYGNLISLTLDNPISYTFSRERSGKTGYYRKLYKLYT